jgi:hypothetical protein
MMMLAVATGGTALGGANVRVTRDATAASYLRYDGTSDATVAVDPHNLRVVVAGANDYLP